MNAIIGSVCIICKDERILLLRRNHPPFKGKWAAPQGLVESGEHPAQTAKREVNEETGLTVAECDHRGHLFLYNKDRSLPVSVDFFVACEYQGELRAGGEGQAVWFPVSEIHKLDLIGFVHVTLPLLLVPKTLLTGTVCHSETGEVISYYLSHHCIIETKVLQFGNSNPRKGMISKPNYRS